METDGKILRKIFISNPCVTYTIYMHRLLAEAMRLNAREWKINFFGGLQVGEVFENFERLNVYLETDDIFLLLSTIPYVKLIIKVLFCFYYLDYFNLMRFYD